MFKEIKIRLLALIKKEFLSIFKDPKNRALIIFPPIIQLFIFAQALTLEVKNIDMVILNYDNGYYSRELVSRFYNSNYFRSVKFARNPDELKHDIDLKESQLGLIIQNDFSRNINSNSKAEILVIADGRQTNSASLVSAYANTIINEFNREFEMKTNKKSPKINIVTRNWYNPNIEYKWFLTVSMIVMLAMILSLLLSALSVARERELLTFNQLLVSPLSEDEILIGKLVPPITVAFCLSIVITLIIAVLFKIHFRGSILLYLIATLVSLFSIIGVGLFISSLSYTQQQAILGVFAFQMPAVLLSGFVSPVEDMPLFFQYLSLLNPLRYYMLIIKGIYLKNMDVFTVFENLVPLILIGVLTLYVARMSFKTQLNR